MSDLNVTQSNNDDVPQKKADSPWDEDLPLEEPKKKLVVGSLDSANAEDLNVDQDKKPVPFNIPANINEEKVGKKIPAEEIISKQPEVSSSPSHGSVSPSPEKTKPELVLTAKPIAATNGPPGYPQAPNMAAASGAISQPKSNQILTQPLVAPAKPGPGISELVQPAGSVAEASPTVKDKVAPGQSKETKPVLPDITPHPEEFNAEKNIDSISDTKVQPKPAEIEPERPDIFAPKIAAIPKVVEEKRQPAPPPIRKPVESSKPAFFKKPSFVIVSSILFLLVAGVYLTEAGLVSLGLENVYGIFGLESLWGGLPRNVEKALGKSAVAMQNQLNFKIKGSVTLTVNKTINSPITTPLVSIAATPYALRDENVSGATRGILTQYDYYNSSSSDDLTTDSSNSSTSSPTPNSASDSSTGYGSQQDSTSYQPEESTIKQIDAEFEGESSEDALKNEIRVKKLVGSDSTISIINSKNDLYLKSSPDIKYASNADSSKWLVFDIPSISQDNPIKDFTNIEMDKGFSIIGRRSGNEKIGSTRCFKYSLDNLEIGDSLDYLGIKSDSVSKISGDIWIGVVDHYIHKIDLKITPSISSSISQISVTFEMYEYGVENSIVIPALSDKIIAETGGTATAATATTPLDQGDMYSRDKTRKSDLQTIKTALETFKQTNGSYPKASEMVKLNVKDNVIQTSLVPEFIAGIPTDPKAAEGWYYGYESDGNKFTLSARLENSDDPQVTKVGEAYIHWVYNN